MIRSQLTQGLNKLGTKNDERGDHQSVAEDSLGNPERREECSRVRRVRLVAPSQLPVGLRRNRGCRETTG